MSKLPSMILLRSPHMRHKGQNHFAETAHTKMWLESNQETPNTILVNQLIFKTVNVYKDKRDGRILSNWGHQKDMVTKCNTYTEV